MNIQAFPIDHYVEILVRLLDTIKYQDNNYSPSERIKTLQYVYSETAKHFAQPIQQDTLKVNPRILENDMRTITFYVVYSFVKLSPEAMVALNIYYVYTALLDDDSSDPYIEMTSFFEDFVHGKQQRHPWLRLMNDHLPNLLSHYGSFCAFNIFRSTLDFFQGNWIEQHNFQGFPGSYDYPLFLRRLNGLGQSVGAALFPAEQFDERALFSEITSAIAQADYVAIFVNDLLSFYKEFDNSRDQTNLVMNYCQVEGISLDQALSRLTDDTIRRCEQLSAVFEGKDPKVVASIEALVQGYVTWHLCDKRYRLSEVYERSGDRPAGAKFRHYYEEAKRVGGIDPVEWALPLSPVAVE